MNIITGNIVIFFPGLYSKPMDCDTENTVINIIVIAVIFFMTNFFWSSEIIPEKISNAPNG